MAAVTVQTASPFTALNHTYASVASGDTVANEGNTVLFFKNGNASARTLTLTGVATDVPGFGVLLPDDLLPVPRGVLTTSDILVNWTGFAGTHEAAMYLGLDRARNMDQWEAGAKRLEVGAVNLIGADQSSIRYRVHASIPDRGKPTTDIKPRNAFVTDLAKILGY